MNVIVGISWPFANGDLHIGHAASSLPGDVIARYHRLKGNNVLLVSKLVGENLNGMIEALVCVFPESSVYVFKPFI